MSRKKSNKKSSRSRSSNQRIRENQGMEDSGGWSEIFYSDIEAVGNKHNKNRKSKNR